jgi:putative DNA primase/helicase
MVEIRTGLEWFDAGYTDLVSVIPPDAGLLPRSKIPAEARGKSPGLRYSSGLWGGYAWQSYQLNRDEVARVDATGANIGLRAERFPAIDIDVLDPKLAELVASIIESNTGSRWYRIGLPPKRLYPFRLEGEPFGRMRLEIRSGEKRYMVEVLGRGQQYVVGGRHPAGTNYSWSGPLVPANELPVLSEEKAKEILQKISAFLSSSGYIVDLVALSPPSSAAQDEDLLAPSEQELAELVKMIPNTLESHPSREDYIRMAAAIKAAGGSFEIFWEWASRWPGRDGKYNTEAVAKKDWDSLRPPFRVGWEWLLDQARLHGVNTAQFEFAALEEARAVEEARLNFPNSAAVCVVREPTVPYSEMWLADRFVRSALTLIRRVPEAKMWLFWNGSSWVEDKASMVPNLLRNFFVGCAAELHRKIQAEPDDKKRNALLKIVKGLESLREFNAVMSFVEADTRLLVPASRLDAFPELLNTPSGPVNLITGERMPPSPDRMLTHATRTPVDFAPPERWLAFLRDVTNGDEQFQSYLQRVAGYAATGFTREQSLFFLWGTGGNGKSVFVNTIQRVLGSYASTVPIEVLLERHYSSHPVELAVLRGQRLAVVNETPSNRTWNEARLKLFAGGDMITARYMYGSPFTFELTAKLFVVGNAKPVLSDIDEAIRRRLRMLPFTFRPANPNPRLAEELVEEYPRILGWIVRGAASWFAEGLGKPAVVEAESEEYISSNDPIGGWLATVTRDASAQERTTDLYESYRDWCISEGENPVTIKRFSILLQNRGFHKKRNAQGQFVFEGISLK